MLVLISPASPLGWPSFIRHRPSQSVPTDSLFISKDLKTLSSTTQRAEPFLKAFSGTNSSLPQIIQKHEKLLREWSDAANCVIAQMDHSTRMMSYIADPEKAHLSSKEASEFVEPLITSLGHSLPLIPAFTTIFTKIYFANSANLPKHRNFQDPLEALDIARVLTDKRKAHDAKALVKAIMRNQDRKLDLPLSQWPLFYLPTLYHALRVHRLILNVVREYQDKSPDSLKRHMNQLREDFKSLPILDAVVKFYFPYGTKEDDLNDFKMSLTSLYKMLCHSVPTYLSASIPSPFQFLGRPTSRCLADPWACLQGHLPKIYETLDNMIKYAHAAFTNLNTILKQAEDRVSERLPISV